MGTAHDAHRRPPGRATTSKNNFKDVDPEISDSTPDMRRHDYTTGGRGSVSAFVVSVDVKPASVVSIVSDWRQRDTMWPHGARVERTSHFPNTARYWTSANEPFRFRVIDTCTLTRVTTSKSNTITVMILKIHETARLRINKNMFHFLTFHSVDYE